MNSLLSRLLLTLGCLGAMAATAAAQQGPVLQAVQHAFESQQIDRETKILYQLYAGLRPDRLPSAFRPDPAGNRPIKCVTPVLMEYQQYRSHFSADGQAAVQQLTGRSPSVLPAEQIYASPSGRFLIYYETSGPQAVPAGDTNANSIPDYVEWTAAAADSSWRHQVQTLGFTDPVTGSTSPYPIYIENLGEDRLYGFTATGDNRGYPGSTYIVINSELDQPAFTRNDAPNPVRGAVQVTLAHELKHAIQYANSRWYAGIENSPHDFDWHEMDATLMEEMVYDPVNDYYNYIDDETSVFLASGHTVPIAYGGITWMLYFAEQYAPAFWVDVWQRIKERYRAVQDNSAERYLSMPGAITATLQQTYDGTFTGDFARSHLWHYASGPQHAVPGYGFEEAARYPDPLINSRLAGPDSITTPQPLPPLTAHYVNVQSPPGVPGRFRLQIQGRESHTGVGLLAYFRDGHMDYRTGSAGADGQLQLTTDWSWDELQKVAVVVTNYHEQRATSFTLRVQSDIPQQATLGQNYPNPFAERTVIPLSLPAAMHVQVNIVDVAGRVVDRPVDGELPAGYNAITFEPRGLAAGIYFVQVIANNRVLVKKITLIK